MKQLLTLTAAVISLGTHAQLNNGLRGHWTFAGGSTSDQSGEGNDGTLTGSAVTMADRFGSPSCAYYFPGNGGGRIDIPFSTDFDIAPSGAFTISLWYQGGSPSAGDLEWIFRKRNTPQFYHVWNYGLALYDLNKPLYFCGDDQQLWSTTNPPIPDPQWHHLVGIYDNGTHNVWLDNVLMASDVSQTYTVTQSLEGCVIGESFMGGIDDIRFYDRAVTPAEVGLLFNEAGACATGVEERSVAGISLIQSITGEQVTINCDASQRMKDNSIALYDLTGQVILRSRLSGPSTTLDLSALSAGIYFLRTGMDSDGSVHRIVRR